MPEFGCLEGFEKAEQGTRFCFCWQSREAAWQLKRWKCETSSELRELECTEVKALLLFKLEEVHLGARGRGIPGRQKMRLHGCSRSATGKRAVRADFNLAPA